MAGPNKQEKNGNVTMTNDEFTTLMNNVHLLAEAAKLKTDTLKGESGDRVTIPKAKMPTKPINVQLTTENDNLYESWFRKQYELALVKHKLKHVLTAEHAAKVIPTNSVGEVPPLPDGATAQAQQDEEAAYDVLMYGLALHPLATNSVMYMKVHDAVEQLGEMFGASAGCGPTELYDEIVCLELDEDFTKFETKWKSLQVQRASMGHPIEEDVQTQMLLATVKRDRPLLHDRVSTTIYTLEGVDQGQLSYRRVLKIVRDMAARLKGSAKPAAMGMSAVGNATPTASMAKLIEQGVQEGIQSALAALPSDWGGNGHGRGGRGRGRGQSNRGTRGGGGDAQRICWVCGSPDHISPHCPSKQQGQDGANGALPNPAYLAMSALSLGGIQNIDFMQTIDVSQAFLQSDLQTILQSDRQSIIRPVRLVDLVPGLPWEEQEPKEEGEGEDDVPDLIDDSDSEFEDDEDEDKEAEDDVPELLDDSDSEFEDDEDDDKTNKSSRSSTGAPYQPAVQGRVDRGSASGGSNSTNTSTTASTPSGTRSYSDAAREGHAATLLRRSQARQRATEPALAMVAYRATSMTQGTARMRSIPDSGASVHIIGSSTFFVTLHDISGSEAFVEGVGGIRMSAVAYGTAHIPTTNAANGKKYILVLEGALLIPTSTANLISTRRLAMDSSLCYTCTAGGEGKLSSGNGSTVRIDLLDDRGVHVLPPPPTESASASGLPAPSAATTPPLLAYTAVPMQQQAIDINDLHKTMAHCNEKDLRATFTNGHVHGPTRVTGEWKDDCVECKLAKPRVLNIPKSNENRATTSMERVSMDFSGMISPTGAGGERYTLTIVDEYSRHAAVLAVNTRAGVIVVRAIKSYCTRVGRKPRVLRVDGAKEFELGPMQAWCYENEVLLEISAPYSQFQNGQAERMQQTLWNGTRASMVGAPHMPKNMWPHASRLAPIINNAISRNGRPTPHELMFGSRPSVLNLLPYGQPVVVKLNIHSKANKFSPRASIGHYLGPAPNHDKRVILARMPETGRVAVVRNFVVNNTPPAATADASQSISPGIEEEEEEDVVGGDTGQVEQGQQMPSLQASAPAPIAQSSTADQQPIALRRSSRQVASEYGTTAQRARANLNHADMAISDEHGPLSLSALSVYMDQEREALGSVYAAVAHAPDPLTLGEAVRDPVYGPAWQAASDDEMKSLDENNTYTLVPADQVPPGATKLRTKWVLRTKEDGRKKARGTVKGYAQRNVGPTFAPVTSPISLRLILIMMVMMQLELAFVDFTNAFLNGDVASLVYLYPFEGYPHPGMMLRLNKCLYGLKESPLAWFTCLCTKLVSVGFIQSIVDRCLFQLPTADGLVWAVVFVDDWVLTGSKRALAIAEAAMRSCFKLRRTDSATHFLGLAIEQLPHGLRLHQHKYITDMLIKFNLDNAHAVPTPTLTTRLEPSRDLTRDEADFMASVPYSTAVGMLNWIACSSRPDISFAVKELSRMVALPLPSHWKAAQRVMRYLRGLPSAHIEYTASRGGSHDIVAYSDADFAGEQSSRKSTSGRVIFVYGNLVVWKAKSQSNIALSSCESEYVAMSETVKDVLFIKQLLAFFGRTKVTAVVIGDNLSSVKIAKHEASMSRTRHVDVKVKFLLHQAAERLIEFKWISTKQMTADLLTKGLAAPLLSRHRSALLSGLD